MIPNITKGSKPVGLLKYLVGPGKRNEHTDPHLVAGSPAIMAWFDDVQLGEDAAVRIGGELDLNRRVTGAELEQHVWHCSLSLRADERPVGDQKWADIAGEFMDGMDFTGRTGKAPCQWVVIHHGTSLAGNDHVHIVASRVREDGTKWHDGADFSRAQRTARAVEKKFGLMQLGRYSERGYKPAEQRPGVDPEAARFRMERIVRSSAVAAGREAEFVRRLRRSGLLVSARFADQQHSVVTGYSVAERPPQGMRALWYGGGKLARDLTLPALRTRWLDTPGHAQEASEEWWAAKRHRRIVHPGLSDRQPGAAAAAGQGLDRETARRLALDLAGARRAMTRVAPDDHQSWAHLARETSGLFAAWSRVAETEPGPLARASRVLARSAHRSGTSISAPLPVPLRMAGTTAFLLAATGLPSPFAQALILQQMLRTIRLLHEMHRTNSELREAALLTEMVRQQLTLVGAPLPEVPEPRLEPLLEPRLEPAVHAGPQKTVSALTEVQPPHLRPHRQQHPAQNPGQER